MAKGDVSSVIADVAAGLPLSILTTALALSLWVAFGSLVLASAEGLGVDPVRRFVIGLVLVLVSALALWQRGAVCLRLWREPSLIVAVALLQLGVVAVDGLVKCSRPSSAVSSARAGLA